MEEPWRHASCQRGRRLVERRLKRRICPLFYAGVGFSERDMLSTRVYDWMLYWGRTKLLESEILLLDWLLDFLNKNSLLANERKYQGASPDYYY